MLDHDLCDVMLSEMKTLGFRDTSIHTIETSVEFIQARTESPLVQRMRLTLLINRIFSTGPYVVPYQIRLALSISTDTIGWAHDLRQTLLPFLKANEEHFFPDPVAAQAA